MNKLIDKVPSIFLLFIPIMNFLAYIGKDKMLDINLHDTYLVISYTQFAFLISVYFILMAIGYWIINKSNIKMSNLFIGIHTIVSTVGVLIILLLNHFSTNSLNEITYNTHISIVNSALFILMQIFFIFTVIYHLIHFRNT